MGTSAPAVDACGGFGGAGGAASCELIGTPVAADPSCEVQSFLTLYTDGRARVQCGVRIVSGTTADEVVSGWHYESVRLVIP
jgi:hypothetical protein